MSLKFEFTADDVVREGRVSRKSIDEVKRWLQSTNLPQVTEEQIVLFILSCRDDFESVKHTIITYYKMKYIGPNMTNNRNLDSKELSQHLTVVDACVMPVRTKENYMIIFQRLKNFSHWNFHLETSIKYLFMTMDMGLLKNPPDGIIALFDMKGLGLMHLTKLRVGPLRIFFNFLQEGMPCQIKNVHVLNSTYFVDKLIAIIKPFLKKELYEMLHFHQPGIDMEEFFASCLEAECVPSDYGGKLPSVQTLNEHSVQKMRQMKDWFEAEEAMRKDYKPQK